MDGGSLFQNDPRNPQKTTAPFVTKIEHGLLLLQWQWTLRRNANEKMPWMLPWMLPLIVLLVMSLLIVLIMIVLFGVGVWDVGGVIKGIIEKERK